MRLFFLFLLGLSVLPASAGDTGGAGPLVLDLQGCIRLALERNQRVLAAKKNVEKADAQIEENGASAWPQVSASAEYKRLGNLPEYEISGRRFTFQPENNYRVGLNVKQKLYAPKVFEAIRASKTFARSAEMEFEAVREEVSLEVKKAFYDHLLAKAMIEVNEEAVEQLKRNVEDVARRLEVGLATDLDLLRAEVQLANAGPELARSRNAVGTSMASLKLAMGIDLSAEVEIVGQLSYSPPHISLDEALSAAVETRPEIRHIDYVIETLKGYAEIARKEFSPTVSMQGNLSYANDSLASGGKAEWDYRWSVGVTMDYKIFDGSERGSRVTQALIEVSKAELERDELINRISLEVTTAYSALREAEELIRSQEKNVERAERAYDIAAVSYRSGVITQLDLLGSQLALTTARSNYKRAVHDFLIAKSNLERAIGRAVPSAEVAPGGGRVEEKYDAGRDDGESGMKQGASSPVKEEEGF